MKFEYFIYAITLRYILFEYELLDTFRDWIDNKLNNFYSDNLQGNLILYLNHKRSLSEVIVNDVLRKLGACSLCNGTWSGYIVYCIFVMNWGVLDLKQLVEFTLFSYSIGLISYIIKELKLLE